MSPLARFELLLENPNLWVAVEGDGYFYNEAFPEFVLRRGQKVTEEFMEPWTQTLPDDSVQLLRVS